jgi:guanine deaminase
MEADLIAVDLASTPAIEQATRRAENLWQELFPTIMMGDDRAIRAVWIGGRKAI